MPNTQQVSEHKQVSMQGEEQIGGASQGGAQGSELQRSVMDQQEEAEWVTADGYYEDGKIITTIPQLESYDPEALQYAIDVALNG